MRTAVLGRKIRTKITAAIVGFSAIVVTGLGLVAYDFAQEALVNATASDLLSLANEKEHAVRYWLEQRKNTVAALAVGDTISDAAMALVATPDESADVQAIHDRIRHELRPWIGATGLFQSMLIVGPHDGTVIFSTLANELATHKANRRYFTAGKSAPLIYGPYYSPTTGSIVVVAAAPIAAKDGSLAGVLVGRIDTSQTNAIMQRRVKHHLTFDSYLVNSARVLVSQPREIEDPAILSRAIYTPAVDRCLAGATGWDVVDDYRGVRTIMAYQWLPDLRLCIVAKLDEVEALKGPRQLGWATLAESVVILLVAGALAFVVSNRLVQPILDLVGATRAIQNGDLDVRLATDGSDELSELAREFIAMSSILRLKDEKIEEHTRTLEYRVEEALRKDHEKETLLREIHHRVKNNLQIILSLLYFQEKKATGAAEIAAIADSRGRLRAMMLVHEKLYQSADLSEIDFAGYVRSLVRELAASYGPRDGQVAIRLEAAAAEVRLPIELAMPSGLLISELIINAFKHAFPDGRSGEIIVRLAEKAGRLTLTVKDNGVGMPEAIGPESIGGESGVSFGWRLILGLVDQIGGVAEVARGGGAEVTISFPCRESVA